MQRRLEKAVEGRYELRGVLGYGGMGAVFLDRLVAIKVLPPTLANDQALLTRFDREARTSAALDHPGIVPIYSVEEVDGLHFFVMKYVPGSDLSAEIDAGAVPVDRARRILVEAARALAHAHDRGVIHRDVKPSNIMLDPEGRVIVADFGIAKATAATDQQVTSTGQALGSPQYMSPEQFESREVDGRSDQYGLGMVAYHMLSGRAPFEGVSYVSMLVKQVTEYPTPLAELRPELPADLVAAVDRAIRKDPAERFPDMVAFADALSGRVPAVPAGAAGSGGAGHARGASPVSRRPWGAALAAVLVVVVAWVGITTLRGDEAATPSPQELEAELQGGSGTDAESELQVGEDPAAPDDARQAAGGGGDDPAEGGPGGGEASPPPTEAATTLPSNPTTGPVQAAPTQPAPAAPTNGFLTVNAQVSAMVAVDGVEIRSTPLYRHEMAPGEYEVRLTRPGYEAYVDTVLITAGNVTSRSYVLIANLESASTRVR
jgi:serine/threonine-protein kinase